MSADVLKLEGGLEFMKYSIYIVDMNDMIYLSPV
jgi:hypothetical protein